MEGCNIGKKAKSRENILPDPGAKILGEKEQGRCKTVHVSGWRKSREACLPWKGILCHLTTLLITSFGNQKIQGTHKKEEVSSWSVFQPQEKHCRPQAERTEKNDSLSQCATEEFCSLMIPQGKKKQEKYVMWKGRMSALQQDILISHAESKVRLESFVNIPLASKTHEFIKSTDDMVIENSFSIWHN